MGWWLVLIGRGWCMSSHEITLTQEHCKIIYGVLCIAQGTKPKFSSAPSQSNSKHTPTIPVVVVDGIVLHLEIVPHHNRAFLPLHATSKLQSGLVAVQVLQQGPTIIVIRPIEKLRVPFAQVQAFPPGFWMHHDSRVYSFDVIH